MTVYTKLTAQPGTALTAMPGTALTAMPGTALTAQPGTVLGPVQEGAQAQEGQEAAAATPTPNAPVALPGKVEVSQVPVALESELAATSHEPEGMPAVAGTVPVPLEVQTSTTAVDLAKVEFGDALVDILIDTAFAADAAPNERRDVISDQVRSFIRRTYVGDATTPSTKAARIQVFGNEVGPGLDALEGS